MSGIRHDRSVIDAFGGGWPKIADRVREEAAGIVAAPESESAQQARSFRERRKALGLTQNQLGELAGYAFSSGNAVVGNLERGAGYPESAVRIEGALEKAESERDNPK